MNHQSNVVENDIGASTTDASVVRRADHLSFQPLFLTIEVIGSRERTGSLPAMVAHLPRLYETISMENPNLALHMSAL